jgi:hypothetical protein
MPSALAEIAPLMVIVIVLALDHDDLVVAVPRILMVTMNDDRLLCLRGRGIWRSEAKYGQSSK